MWILMKKSYFGKFGIFHQDQKYDLPENTISQLRKEKQLGGENVIDTCAPWEEHVDRNAVKRNEFLAKVNAAISKAETLIAKCVELVSSIETSQKQLEVLRKEQLNAVNEAKKLAKSAGIEWPPKIKDADDAE